jgi:hypothetical protein
VVARIRAYKYLCKVPDLALMTPQERQLRRLVKEARETDRRILDQVRKMRRGGATWAAVGAALDVTQQAAHARFAKRV